MKTNATIIAISLVLLQVGCAQFRTQSANQDYWIKPGQAQASSRVAALLYYADYVRNLGAAEYAQEAEHARSLYASEKTDFRLLQYALALSVSGGDARKAQQLIEPLLKVTGTTDAELAALAQLLNSDLAERRRLEADTKRAAAGAKRAEAGAKRADELEKQVEAIKNIEKNLIGRGKNSGEKQ
jgi:hypothetical protein